MRAVSEIPWRSKPSSSDSRSKSMVAKPAFAEDDILRHAAAHSCSEAILGKRERSTMCAVASAVRLAVFCDVQAAC